MNCERAKKAIIEAFYDEVSPELASELQEHLVGCEDCSKYESEIQRVYEYLDREEEVNEPLNLYALHDAVDAKQRRIWQSLRPRWSFAMGFVGVCGILLFVFSLFASEIQYKDNMLIVRFGNKAIEQSEQQVEELRSEINTLSEKSKETGLLLANYRRDQLRFQEQLSDELRNSIISLSQMISDYESQRDNHIDEVFQQMQIQQYKSLVAIKNQFENLAFRTENEFKRSYLTMAAIAESGLRN